MKGIRLLTPLRTILYHPSPQNPSHLVLLLKPSPGMRLFSLSSSVTSARSSPVPSLSGTQQNLKPDVGLFVARCVSPLSSLAAEQQQPHTVEWNEPVLSSEFGNGGDDGSVAEDTRPSIPVRAYFFSTSVDLKSLVEQNKPNFIPPTSRMTNYVVFKFGNLSQSMRRKRHLRGGFSLSIEISEKRALPKWKFSLSSSLW